MSDVTPESPEIELAAEAETDGSASAAPSRLSVVLVEPEIAANTGAIGRSCVAAGARIWLIRPLGFHLDDRHLHRAGLDYWSHLDLTPLSRNIRIDNTELYHSLCFLACPC